MRTQTFVSVTSSDSSVGVANATGWTYTDPEVSSTIATSLQMSLAYIIIGCLGAVGNATVCLVLVSARGRKHNYITVYIINQSTIDLLVSLILISSAHVNSDVSWPGLAGAIYCKIWQSKLFLWGFLVSSTYNLVCLTLERYLQVCKPVWHKLSFTDRQVNISLLLVWLSGPLFNAAYMIPSSFVIDGVCSIYSKWPSVLVQKLFGLTTVLIQFFIPLTILIFCYTHIALTLHKKIKSDSTEANRTKEGSSSTRRVTQDAKWHRGRRNTIITLIIVAVCFVLCWSWNQMLFFFNHLGYQADFTSNFYHFTVIAVFLNSVLNPVVYAFKYEPFQKAFRSLCCRCSRGGRIRPARESVSEITAEATCE